MILEANERGHGTELAQHLLNPRDNDHVTVHAIEGFVASDLADAFAESEAISQGTQCRKYLFSLSLNPPPNARVTVEAFEEAIARVEAKLGLAGQPRAIVFHEKNGRRHAHCVWSRIDASRMRAINMAHSKRKLMDVSISLYRDHGWSMPEGFDDHLRRDPLNYSRAEAGQAKRASNDPKAVKALFQKCWQQSDSRSALAAALWAEGYCLARGERRGFVAVDANGKVWSLARWCGIKTKELNARLGSLDDLPSTEEAVQLFKGLQRADTKTGAIPTDPSFELDRRRLIDSQRQERDALIAAQERRLVTETVARRARLPRGLRGAWARLNGSYDRIVEGMAQEAAACAARDRQERQVLIDRHLNDRRALERQRGASDLTTALDALFLDAVRPDIRQKLVLPKEAVPFTAKHLAEEPSQILSYLSHKKASFSELEIKRALADFIDDPLTLRPAIDKACVASELIRLDDGNFTTVDYRIAERSLEADAREMASSGGFAVVDHHATGAMEDQDQKMQDRFGGKLSDEQRAAVLHVLGDSRLACAVGLAGSGKSTMLETARDAWTRQGIRVHGAALSGKAADGLQSASGIESRTLASLETSWKNGNEPIARGDVLVVDEAGMVGTRQMMRIARKLRQIGAKLVLIGDPGQLQPIEAGTPFRDLVERHGAATLNEIHRQKEQWQRHASRDLAEGRIEEAIKAYDADGAIHRSDDRASAIAALLQDYMRDRETNGLNCTQLAFAHRRKDVFALNQAIRNAIRLSGDAMPETVFSTETGERAFAEGDRIVFTRNDQTLGVKNGMLGTVKAVNDGVLSVALDGDSSVRRSLTFDPLDYRSFDHGYAVTIHKSQGATVDRAYVLASRTMDAPLAYVAMTRHRENLRLYVCGTDAPVWLVPERHFNRHRRTPVLGQS